MSGNSAVTPSAGVSHCGVATDGAPAISVVGLLLGAGHTLSEIHPCASQVSTWKFCLIKQLTQHQILLKVVDPDF